MLYQGAKFQTQRTKERTCIYLWVSNLNQFEGLPRALWVRKPNSLFSKTLLVTVKKKKPNRLIFVNRILSLYNLKSGARKKESRAT